MIRNLFILLSLVLFFSCQNDSISSSENYASDKIDESLYKGKPAQSGPYVVRFETFLNDGVQSFYIYSDEKTGLTAVLGVNAGPFCSGDEFLMFDILPLQQVSVPEDETRLNILQKGDVQTEIYEGIFEGGSVCDFTDTHELVAGGTSRIVITDNDLRIFESDNAKNHNSYGFRAHGNLTTPEGETVRYNGHSNSVWDGVDTESIKTNSKINLK